MIRGFLLCFILYTERKGSLLFCIQKENHIFAYKYVAAYG